MIRGITANRHIDEALSILQHSNFTFYLTGSRFFGNEKPSSDWDFYTEKSAAVEAFLMGEGYVTNPNSRAYTDDMNTAAVMEKVVGPGRGFSSLLYTGSADIQIQLVRDIKIKTMIQQVLVREGCTMGKEDVVGSKTIWRVAYNIASRTRAELARTRMGLSRNRW